MLSETFYIDGPMKLTSPVHADARGSFMESFHLRDVENALGFNPHFVQDNISRSDAAGTLRGLHLQTAPAAQAKLVRCIQGSITDVIVDVRRGSPTYGEHLSVSLTQDDGTALWVPEGFLHGFVTRTLDTVVLYKVTAHYNRNYDINVIWNDPKLNIDWALGTHEPTLSEKDAAAMSFSEFAAKHANAQ